MAAVLVLAVLPLRQEVWQAAGGVVQQRHGRRERRGGVRVVRRGRQRRPDRRALVRGGAAGAEEGAGGRRDLEGPTAGGGGGVCGARRQTASGPRRRRSNAAQTHARPTSSEREGLGCPDRKGKLPRGPPGREGGARGARAPHKTRLHATRGSARAPPRQARPRHSRLSEPVSWGRERPCATAGRVSGRPRPVSRVGTRPDHALLELPRPLAPPPPRLSHLCISLVCALNSSPEAPSILGGLILAELLARHLFS
jgi:hypothetical protein